MCTKCVGGDVIIYELGNIGYIQSITKLIEKIERVGLNYGPHISRIYFIKCKELEVAQLIKQIYSLFHQFEQKITKSHIEKM